MKTRVMGDLKKVFRPELLNRIDEVIVFPKLTKEEILQIVEILMKRLREQMATHEVTIELTDEAKELLVDKGYDPSMGARPLRRAIQRYIEDPLADFVLRSQLEPGATVMVDALEDGKEPEEGEDPIKLSIIEPKKVPAAVGAPDAEAGDGDEGPDVPALDDAPQPPADSAE